MEEIIIITVIKVEKKVIPSFSSTHKRLPFFKDSYLAKLNYAKKTPQFKPYTGRDYEQFKKNYGFGTGHLGYNFESTTHKEKVSNPFSRLNKISLICFSFRRKN